MAVSSCDLGGARLPVPSFAMIASCYWAVTQLPVPTATDAVDFGLHHQGVSTGFLRFDVSLGTGLSAAIGHHGHKREAAETVKLRWRLTRGESQKGEL